MSTPRSTPDGRGEKPRVGGLFVPTRKPLGQCHCEPSDPPAPAEFIMMRRASLHLFVLGGSRQDHRQDFVDASSRHARSTARGRDTTAFGSISA